MKMHKGYPVVEAYVINLTHIIFKCPYHKKKTYVKHGSCGDLTNRLEHRASDCSCKELEGGYFLEVKQTTPRACLGSVNQILKRFQPTLKELWIKQQVEKGTFDVFES